ncbi:MAG: hypothetical protein LW630_07330 [Saprospiraceae bacterium]|jgi:hypothetical protein|nr:hypothetical protein [Saprospiraceae bacterium]
MGFFNGLKRLFFPNKSVSVLQGDDVVSSAAIQEVSNVQYIVSEKKEPEATVFSIPRDEIMDERPPESEDEK